MHGTNKNSESMKGWSSSKVIIQQNCIRNKSTKWGFEVWIRVCAETGYIFQITLYDGKGAPRIIITWAWKKVSFLVYKKPLHIDIVFDIRF